jgi:hypothetical protein
MQEALNPGTSSIPDRIAVLKDRISGLLAKLGKINPADKDAKTQMAIIKSDIATAKLRLQGLQGKKEAVDVLGPLGSIDIESDLITPANMPSFMKFGESLESLKESNRYTVKSIVKDPAAMAGGEKNEPKEKSRVVLAKTPEEAKSKVAADLKERGYTIASQTIIKTEKLSEDEKKKGLWANIHARRKKGLRPKRPGEEGYPKTLDIESKENIEEKDKDDPCWVGYKQVGMKKKNGKEVPNCVPESTKLESVLNLIRRIKEKK